MNKKERMSKVVTNFICTMDMSQPIEYHIDNAHLDADLYNLDKDTLNKLLEKIVEAYRGNQ